MSRHERLSIPDVELSRPALALAKRFVQRWDLYARQLADGRYICVHETLGVDQILSHLRGEITLGAYLLDEESRARFIVLDADDVGSWQRLGHLADALARKEVPVYLEGSSRGGHLWLFFAQKVSGRDARAFGHGLLAAHEIEGVELFPKQDELASGPGSLIRMPFGVHWRSGRRYAFYTPDGVPLAPSVRAQIDALGAAEPVPGAGLETYRSFIPPKPALAAREPKEAPTGTVSERIKASVTVLEFVSRYVELKPVGSGALGLCPFHDDHNPSFGVNDEENYWNCFAGCGGGSVIDFWMKWQTCDFKTAVKELAGMFL
jgi:hypothetical protein